MFFGVSALQSFHVAISLVGIAVGLWVMLQLIASNRAPFATAVFLGTTLVTLLTGFFFPITSFTPALGVGIVSTLVMAATLLARYGKGMRGRWREVYVIGAVASLYLNVFVLVVQLFLKVPALNALAPTGTEPPFAMAQGVTLAVFATIGFLAWKGFRPAASTI